MNDQKLLRKIQLIQLEIMKQVDTICKKHNIKYFLCGGTALGAVRHNGFIPWDDDLDIALPRDQYNRLLNVLKTELPEQYWLQSYATDEHYWQPFAKIRKVGTVYKEKGMEKLDDTACGVWIDIFPFDYAGKKGTFRLKWKGYWVKLISFTLRAREFHLKNSSFSRRYVPAILLLRCFPSSVLKKMQEKIMCGDTEKAMNFVCFAGAYGIKKETYPLVWFEELIDIPFEDAMLSIPKGYDNYLKQLYGDYMQLPPVDKRKGHNISDLCKIIV